MASTAQGPEIIKLNDVQSTFADKTKLRTLLTSQPRKLHAALSYNEEGSESFSDLLNQPEYYLAHAERRLLKRDGANIIATADPDYIIDLGCGGMEKVQILLHEATKRKGKISFAPCDIDDSIIKKGIERLSYFYGQDIDFLPVQGTFEDSIDWTERLNGNRLFTFLGSTYGNFTRAEKDTFLTRLTRRMGDGDSFLLALDLEKDRETMERAYRDSGGCVRQGVIQALVNLNDCYGANFDVDKFDHLAVYEAERKAIVEYLVNRERQLVDIPYLDLQIDIQEGERFETEFSEKFVLEDVMTDMARWNLVPAQLYMDVEHKYTAVLFQRRAGEAANALQAAA